MSSALLRTTARAGLRASVAKPMAQAASTSFIRGKATLPDLSCKLVSLVVFPSQNHLPTSAPIN